MRSGRWVVREAGCRIGAFWRCEAGCRTDAGECFGACSFPSGTFARGNEAAGAWRAVTVGAAAHADETGVDETAGDSVTCRDPAPRKDIVAHTLSHGQICVRQPSCFCPYVVRRMPGYGPALVQSVGGWGPVAVLRMSWPCAVATLSLPSKGLVIDYWGDERGRLCSEGIRA